MTRAKVTARVFREAIYEQLSGITLSNTLEALATHPRQLEEEVAKINALLDMYDAPDRVGLYQRWVNHNRHNDGIGDNALEALSYKFVYMDGKNHFFTDYSPRSNLEMYLFGTSSFSPFSDILRSGINTPYFQALQDRARAIDQRLGRVEESIMASRDLFGSYDTDLKAPVLGELDQVIASDFESSGLEGQVVVMKQVAYLLEEARRKEELIGIAHEMIGVYRCVSEIVEEMISLGEKSR